jgi:peroxiredoxin
MKRIFVVLTLIFLSVSEASAAAQKVVFKGENILTGREIEVGAKKSQAVVVIFLSSKCPCSDSHIAELQDLSRDFSDFEFVGIHSNVDEDLEFSKNYFEQKKLPFVVLQDRSAQLADRFKAFKTPHAFVLGSEGQILYQGGVTNSAQFSRANRKFLREALEDIRAHKAVRTPEGRTLGCVIARSK